jgi:hypothetical protein
VDTTPDIPTEDDAPTKTSTWHITLAWTAWATIPLLAMLFPICGCPPIPFGEFLLPGIALLILLGMIVAHVRKASPLTWRLYTILSLMAVPVARFLLPFLFLLLFPS